MNKTYLISYFDWNKDKSFRQVVGEKTLRLMQANENITITNLFEIKGDL